MYVKLYCDGGSINNGQKEKDKPVYGAYCTLLVNRNDEIQKTFVETFKNVTNNQMELYSCIRGLNWLKNYQSVNKFENGTDIIEVDIISDSQYLVTGSTQWIHGWKKRGWRNSSNEQVANIDLWKIMDELLLDETLKLNFIKVKGHSGKNISKEKDNNVYFNEKCDSLLSEALDKIRAKL